MNDDDGQRRRRAAQMIVYRIEAFLRAERRDLERNIGTAREWGYEEFAQSLELGADVEEEILADLKRRFGVEPPNILRLTDQ